MAEFASSRWDTTYDSPSGPIRAIINFNNDKGDYDLVDDSNTVFDVGSITNVRYHVTTDSIWLITGSWSLRGETGFFQFDADGGPDSFKGNWAFSPPTIGGGRWNGFRIP